MLCYLSACVALFLPLAHGYVAEMEYPKFTSCHDRVLAGITGYWIISGKPENVLQEMEKNGEYTVIHTSYDYFNSDNKCLYMNTTNGLMDFTFVPKTGSTTAKTSYIVEEGDDGVIKGKPVENDAPEYRWNWYSVYANDGLVICYVCSDIANIEGSMQPPLIDIMVANRHKSTETQAAIRTARSVLEGWGLNLKYDYELECF